MTTNNTPSPFDKIKSLLNMSQWGGGPQSNAQYDPTTNGSSGWSDLGGKIAGQAAGSGSGVLGGMPGGGGGNSTGGPGWLSQMGIFGGTDKNGVTTNGWGGTALSGAKAFGDMYSSMKQFGLAEDMFDNSKDQFNKNWGAQTKNYNADIEDRQRARVASNAGAYESVGDYMNKNRMV
jgi:hypothetical protein